MNRSLNEKTTFFFFISKRIVHRVESLQPAFIQSLLFTVILFVFSLDTALAEDFLKSSSRASNDDPMVIGQAPRFDLLAAKLSPSVVNIAAQTEEEGKKRKKGRGPDLPPGQFPPENGLPGYSMGSGFIVSSDGHIATNYHVIRGAQTISVRLLNDKRDYSATVVGVDEKTDLGLIKIDPPYSLPITVIGDSDALQVGEWVLAIGNQFQLGQTVTAGIVSAKSRRVPSQNMGAYDDYIQTDASINPGSSGGPLFNMHGEVIGINTAIFSPGRNPFSGAGFNIGIGFAIPMNLARGVLNQLRFKGVVTRGVLGVIVQDIDAALAQALRLEKPEGALVADVVEESPAALARFAVKDVIISYNGKSVTDHSDLPLLVASTPIGETVTVEVLRKGHRKLLHPTITELTKDYFSPSVSEIAQRVFETDSLGISGRDRPQEGTKQPGVLVEKVLPSSPAARAGIVEGDVILEMDNRRVLDRESLRTITVSLAKGTPVLVFLEREEGTRFLTVEITE